MRIKVNEKKVLMEFEITLTDADNDPGDLTGATATLNVQGQGSRALEVTASSRTAMTCRYVTDEDDFDVGVYEMQVVIVTTDGGRYTLDRDNLEVEQTVEP